MSGYFPFEMSLTRSSVYRALDMDIDAGVEEETAARCFPIRAARAIPG
jgi:hypothetical protein